ncbi:recombinase family protein [Neotabrizicola sp. VNH66]|uniref:recombinase family protein n=1 Tax=Neotabrizicola sp. VNH66 TaxID=3400918 RepID=UPI003C082D06
MYDLSILTQDNENASECVLLDLPNHFSYSYDLQDSQIGQKGQIMGELIGYARVSSRGQSLDVQEDALRKAGVSPEHLYSEKVSGRSRDGRQALAELLGRGIRKGDTVVCTRLDRLARSTRDLLEIAKTLEDKGVHLRVLEQPIDTSTAAGKLFFTILGAFGEFEATIRAERQREGIDAALAKGAESPFRGRPVTLDAEKVVQLKAEGMSPTAIAKKLGIARSSVYRLVQDAHSY